MPAEDEYGSNNTSPQMLQPSASNTTQDKVQVVEASPDKVKKKYRCGVYVLTNILIFL